MGYYKNMLIDLEDDRVMDAKIAKLERRITEQERRITELEGAVEEALEYFEDRADLDMDDKPNREMSFTNALRVILGDL
jgi:hypothetical protein